MRTPGRCNNLEGCWIGATQRDVWLSIGDDFACPNCGNVLTAPPRRAVSLRQIKKISAIAAGMAVGVVVLAMAGMKLSALHWATQQPFFAGRHAAPGLVSLAGANPARLTHGQVPADAGSLVALATLAPRAGATSILQPSAPNSVDSEDRTALTFARPPASRMPGEVRSAPQAAENSVLLFAGVVNKPSPARATPAQQTSADDAVADLAPAPAALVTMVSEAAFVLPITDEPPVVLPISFGRPQAPEDDSPPVSLRWRFHGFTARRQSYFLPGPVTLDALTEICRTPALLR